MDWAPSRKSVGDPFEQQSETVPSSEGTARGRKAPTLDLRSRAASGDDSSPRCEDSTHPFGQNGIHLYRWLELQYSHSGGQTDMDELIRAATNHPLVLLALAIIIVLILMKTFNQLK